MRWAQKCPECGAEFERTLTGFSVCPTGHGKLYPGEWSLSEADKKKQKREAEKKDQDDQDKILTKYGLRQKELQ